MYGLFYIAEFELQGYEHHEFKKGETHRRFSMCFRKRKLRFLLLGKGRDYSTSKSVWDLVMNS